MSKMSNLHAVLTEQGKLPECPDDSDYEAPTVRRASGPNATYARINCATCGGSGGGPECFRCPTCGGSGVRKVRRENPNDDDNRPE